MTIETWTLPQVDEAALCRIAELLALKLRAGDAVSLEGELGAGKTTLARALIRAVLGDAGAEVPSPTFSLLQTYDTPRLTIAHLDLYRLTGDDDVLELGVDELRAAGVIVVEWAARAPSILGPDRLEVALSEGPSAETRAVRLTGHGTWDTRLARVREIAEFLAGEPAWRMASVLYLQGDASVRAYARLNRNGPELHQSVPDVKSDARTNGIGPPRYALLMDWPRQPDGPPIRNGLPYSRIAHLAEGVSAFVAVGQVLRQHGFTAPELYAADLERGLLLTEDFGDRVFGREVASGRSMQELWQMAVGLLVDLRRIPAADVAAIALEGAPAHHVPRYDSGAMGIEAELLLDWYWPMMKGEPAPESERSEFLALWAPHFAAVTSGEPCLVLRDYHSPNLIWIDGLGADPKASVGLIDFQDAMLGHPAYDLVSLLQDARLDVPAGVEGALLAHYVKAVSAADESFSQTSFERAYAIMGAQRNTKILGIFARLAKRDRKEGYLTHIPRIWTYLARNLEHPGLRDLASWYDTRFPAAARARAPKA